MENPANTGNSVKLLQETKKIIIYGFLTQVWNNRETKIKIEIYNNCRYAKKFVVIYNHQNLDSRVNKGYTQFAESWPKNIHVIN